MEVFYLANKSENLYFAVLGDCSESNIKDEAIDVSNNINNIILESDDM